MLDDLGPRVRMGMSGVIVVTLLDNGGMIYDPMFKIVINSNVTFCLC